MCSSAASSDRIQRSWSRRVLCVIPPPLTKLHADVLVWVLLPQLLIAVCVTHEWENHILNDALQKVKQKQGVSDWIQWHGHGFIKASVILKQHFRISPFPLSTAQNNRIIQPNKSMQRSYK